MQGNTHRVGGMLCAIAGYSYLQSRGMLIQDINPLLQLAVMYPFAIYGSILPDLDHHWQSCPSKDFISYGINKVLHLTTGIRKKTGKNLGPLSLFDAKHRSWQTHSLLSLFLIVALCIHLVTTAMLGINGTIFKMISTGLILGLISHLVLDMLTPEGIWLVVPSAITRKKKMLHLTPKTKFFATGGPWETLVRCIMWLAIAVFILRLVYIALPYKVYFNF